MILVIDNYDSFVYNLVQAVGQFEKNIQVYRNDKITINKIKKLDPSHIIISPGPCTPKEAGISNSIIKEIRDKPILGVCLGHQCIGRVFGAKIIKAPKPCHGKTSTILHDKKKLFKNVVNPLKATRYHSLVIDPETIPRELEITAFSGNIIMGIRHKQYNIEGVQFHPESFLTKHGSKMLQNFLELK